MFLFGLLFCFFSKITLMNHFRQQAPCDKKYLGALKKFRFRTECKFYSASDKSNLKNKKMIYEKFLGFNLNLVKAGIFIGVIDIVTIILDIILDVDVYVGSKLWNLKL